MIEKKINLTRRKFIAASSTVIAAPFVMNMADKVPEAKGARKEAKNIAEKNYFIYA